MQLQKYLKDTSNHVKYWNDIVAIALVLNFKREFYELFSS